MYSRATLISHILPIREVYFIYTPFFSCLFFLENILELESRAGVQEWDVELCYKASFK